MIGRPSRPEVTRDLARGESAKRELLLLGALTVLCGTVAATVQQPALRVAAALMLELVLPGLALIAFVARRRELGTSGLALCALGASLAVAALGSLALNLIPGKTGRVEWAILLVFITLLALGAAARWPLSEPDEAGLCADRDRRQGRRDPFYLRWARALEASALAVLNVALGVLAIGLVIAAIAVAGHAAGRSPGFTELSALPSPAVGGTALAVLVASHEHRPASFVVVVREDGRVRNETPIELSPLQSWQVTVPLRRSGTRAVRVEVKRADSDRAYLQTVYYPPAGPTAQTDHARRTR
jgi:uncharacterized membrane protein